MKLTVDSGRVRPSITTDGGWKSTVFRKRKTNELKIYWRERTRPHGTRMSLPSNTATESCERSRAPSVPVNHVSKRHRIAAPSALIAPRLRLKTVLRVESRRARDFATCGSEQFLSVGPRRPDHRMDSRWALIG